MSNAERCKKYRETKRAVAKSTRNMSCETQTVSSVTCTNTGQHGATRGNTPSLPSDPSLLSDPSLPSKEKESVASVTTRNGNRKKARVAKGTPTWVAYSEAYAKRYGREPLRNAKTNALCVQLVDALGADISPKVAAHYLVTNAQPYAGSGHTLALLVRDYQKIHTEWETGRRVTQSKAREADRLQGTGDAWHRVMERRGE